MKKLIKNVACLTLATTMFLSSTNYVYAYTTDELLLIRDSKESTALFAIGNDDLEYYVSKSDAENSKKNIISYANQKEYQNAGKNEGRRAGIKAGIDEFYDGRFPKTSDATDSLAKKSDAKILAENKISVYDQFKDVFLASYKENYLDAYSMADYELAGYYFGEAYAEKDLIRYDLYSPKPALTEVYKVASKDLFTSYGVKATDNYADSFQAGFSKGYELTYTKDDANLDIVYRLGKTAGYEKALEIKSTLKPFEDLKTELETYVKSSTYRTEKTKFLSGFNGDSNLGELEDKFDEGFKEGANSVLTGSTGETGEVIFSAAGKVDGDDIGSKAATTYAKSDYIYHKSLDAESAYNDYMSKVDFDQRYRLYMLPSDYVAAFKAAVYDSFITTYNATYLTLKGDTIKESQFIQLPTNGDLIAPHQIVTSSKEIGASFGVDFGAANFFDKSYVNVVDTGRFWDYNTAKYTAYSNAYKVEVYNESTGVKQDFIKLKQPMLIAFTHDLGENVGVYKVEGNQLKYLHTKVENKEYKVVYTEIPAGKYYGGTYVLLADENIKKVKDITTNWNYDGLETYNRRGWLPITADGYAKPDTNITRAQFAFMLERNLNKSNTVVAQPVNFADANKFNGYTNAINYCVSKGYFTVGSDKKFRPQDTMSYAEVETVLNRALGYSVPFSTIDASMQNTAFHKSKYSSNKKSPITISEAIYSLMYVFQ